MKKLILIIGILFYMCSLASAQLFVNQDIYIETPKKSPRLDVVVENVVIIIPSMSIEQQCAFVAYRATHPTNGNAFDTAFFKKSLSMMENTYASSSYVKILKIWGSVINSFGEYNIPKANYISFLKKSENFYLLPIEIKKSTNKYDIVEIGDIKIQVIKKTFGFWRRVVVKDGFYHLKNI